jgi:CheY-specific phosphatase CheX
MNPPNPKPTFDDLIFQVGEMTFGELAFMLVIPEEVQSVDAPPAPWGYAGHVDFTGPFNGQLYCVISADLLEPLAANMLGIDTDEELPEGVRMEDALKELLNVIAGNLLPAIAGDEVVFHIGGPVLMDRPALPTSMPGKQFAGKAEMTLDAGRAALALFVDEDAQLPEPA